jgi:hypothetical protein
MYGCEYYFESKSMSYIYVVIYRSSETDEVAHYSYKNNLYKNDLKVHKCEIFGSLGFSSFLHTIEPFWVGDFGVKI